MATNGYYTTMELADAHALYAVLQSEFQDGRSNGASGLKWSQIRDKMTAATGRKLAKRQWDRALHIARNVFVPDDMAIACDRTWERYTYYLAANIPGIRVHSDVFVQDMLTRSRTMERELLYMVSIAVEENEMQTARRLHRNMRNVREELEELTI
jgi:hypothetical protein